MQTIGKVSQGNVSHDVQSKMATLDELINVGKQIEKFSKTHSLKETREEFSDFNASCPIILQRIFYEKKFFPKAFVKYFRAARFHGGYYKDRKEFYKAQSEYAIGVIMLHNKNKNIKEVREFIYERMEYEAKLAEAAKDEAKEIMKKQDEEERQARISRLKSVLDDLSIETKRKLNKIANKEYKEDPIKKYFNS